MKLSTKARYAVQALADIAHVKENKPVSLLDIHKRQGISQHYLEQLFSKLRRSGIVTSSRGQSGGYSLAVSPENLTILDIINAVEETINSTRCSKDTSAGCNGRNQKCIAHNLWRGMENVINNYLGSITLADVVERRVLPADPTTNATGMVING